jgi:serine/threonine-protein kinase
LGVVAYECLSGSLPLVGDAPDEMEQLHRTEIPHPLGQTNPDLPAHVSDAVQRALSKTPAERFPTVLDFVALLRKDWSPSMSEMFAPEGRPSSPSRVFLIDEDQQRLPVLPILVTTVVVLMVILGSLWIKPWQLFTAAGDGGSQATPTTVTRPIQTTVPGEFEAEPEAVQGEDATAPVEGSAGTNQAPAAVSPRSPGLQPGVVFINSTPWGQVYIDDVLVGNTPLIDTLVAGLHVIRVVRPGFESYESEVQLAPGQQIRLTGITLRARQR